MAIEISKIVSGVNVNNISKINTGFRGTTNPIQNDTVEITGKKKGLSDGKKIALGLGVIGAILGGIFLHKHFSTKATAEAAKELSQAVKDLVSQGKITQKEAELFDKIHNLEGEEFVNKAYELIAKDLNMEKYPRLIVSLESKGNSLGHTGEDITIFIKEYERYYGKENAKQEIINTLRHELEHFKQDIIIFKQKGEQAYRTAFEEQKRGDIVRKAVLRGKELNQVLDEEAVKYSYNPEGARDVAELYRLAFEHDTPIKTIRTMSASDFEKLHLTSEELAKVDEYLEGNRTYLCSGCFPESFYKSDGEFDIARIREIPRAMEFITTYMGKGYWENPIELGARHAGETLRERFKLFLDAIK